ncbi:Thiamine biosynthesis protein thiI [Mycoplasmopsis meleagridis]|uniref:Probable tRNA sulfurtransferase n=1 Tax=Mycoplasmopsis meleagridis ATCC 25294 TaxID=1264554 RepID=A0A0F5H180_9BACT|nr:tRNA uracil 4-sulfurtransferase ThiI [Mycoplasmopsis meleagridis]KKB26612.1 Thiamine biosynthesis protein thiI [Mycoplasmopsis meleagridis ATCC 25294]OAD18483.1 Thiamine biosynthesis protein thiI [Mycoplasmopsis meleagridis]VEU77648.1 thiamine biosynthesis protein ThiI [Mycoplasmopsis meleagridis]
MYNKILIRYGELTLKHKNRDDFTKKLAHNIKNILKVIVIKQFDRMFIPYSENNLEKLKYIFGIQSYSPVVETSKEFDNLVNIAKTLINEKIKTFKINARRADKNYFLTSNEINQKLGAILLANFPHLKVDLNSPDLTINIEIRKDFAYVFTKEIKASGGLPTGISGRVLHLMSGGIDSPVAAYKLMKRGLEIVYLSFISPPQTDQKTIDKLNSILKILNNYQGQSTLYLANYAKLMNYISLVSNQAYKINLMRRSFYRIANKLANKLNIKVLSNGENLGQVASQTLESIQTIASSSNLVIFRPLLTNDKIETIDLAKNIGTYELSIQKANETCELFAPKSPVTKPKIEEVLKLEKELNLLEQLEDELLKSLIEVIKIEL